MCLKQKKGCDERSKLILLSADNRFCVQHLKKMRLPKKFLRNSIIFFVAKGTIFFVRPHKKFFAFFSVRFAQMIFAVGKY